MSGKRLETGDQRLAPEIGGDSRLEESLLTGDRRPWTMGERSYVLNAFAETPWAILPSQLMVLQEIVERHVAGEKLSADEVQARINGAQRPAMDRKANAVAVLPLWGTIFPRANMMTEMSGATSAEMFGKEFSALVGNPEVSAIVLDVDSPGGQVNGIEELSNQIYDARGSKPIVAVANHLMASAAYWVGTAADEVVITPSGEAGSIGVFAVHEDRSALLAQRGVKVSLISAGKYKVEGNPYEPLAEEARGAIQTSVNDYYEAFVSAVARNRGSNPDAVRNGFGEGRVVGARQAVALGMADRVGTLEETISRLLNGDFSSASQRTQSVNHSSEPGSSDPAKADLEDREAQRLRDYVQIFK